MSKKDNWDMIFDSTSVASSSANAIETPQIENTRRESHDETTLSSASTQRSSSSSSTSKLGTIISTIDKNKCIDLFQTFEEEKMWKLSSGRYVEIIMKEMLENLNYEQ